MRRNGLVLALALLMAAIPVQSAFAAKAAMVTDLTGLSGSKEQKGFNDLAWDGFLKARDELGVDVLLVESREQADYVPNLRRLARSGYDVIVGVGFLLTDAIDQVAAEFPKVRFAIIDSVVDRPNVASYVFKEEEGSFLAGVLAAQVTTQKGNPRVNPANRVLGFVGGMEFPLIKKFEVGFRAGAAAVDPGIRVLVGYAGSFTDPGKGKEIARAQIAQGADVIYHASGSTGIGVIEAAREAGRYAIGVDTDQNALAPGTVLVSVLKRVDVASFEAIRGAVQGTFKPGVHVLGLSEGGVALSPLHEAGRDIPQEFMRKVEAYAEMIRAGKLAIPVTEEELQKFKAPQA